MALSYKSRRRWSMFILVIGLPVYIAAVWFLLSLLEGWSIWVQMGVCLVFSLAWAFPLKAVFMGVGQADPDAPSED